MLKKVILLSLITSASFAQKVQKDSSILIEFDTYSKYKFKTINDEQTVLLPYVKRFYKGDTTRNEFIIEHLRAANIDFSRISIQKDSLQITDSFIKIIYRKKKTTKK